MDWSGAFCEGVRGGEGVSICGHAAAAGSPATHLEVLYEALEVKTDGLLVVVAVLLDLKARVLERRRVVTPRRRRQVDGLGVRVMTSQEGAANPQRTRTRDGLRRRNTTFLDGRRVFAVCQHDGVLDKVGETSDGKVLLVVLLSQDLLLGLADRGQDVGLAVLIAVSSYTQVDLARVLVLLEGLGDAQDRVRGTSLDVGPGALRRCSCDGVEAGRGYHCSPC